MSIAAQMPDSVSAREVGRRGSVERGALVDQAVAADEQDQVLGLQVEQRIGGRVVGGPRGAAVSGTVRRTVAGARLGGEHAELVVGLGEVDAEVGEGVQLPELAPPLDELMSKSLPNSPMPPPVAPRWMRSASTFGRSMPTASTPARRSRIEPARVVSVTSLAAVGAGPDTT